MLIISFVLVTPAYVEGVLNPVKDDFANKFVDASMSQYIQDYFAPMVTLCINFGMIPFMIDFAALYEDYRRKSSF